MTSGVINKKLRNFGLNCDKYQNLFVTLHTNIENYDSNK